MDEKKKNLIIAVDFDGTLCEDKYPLAGAPNYKLINSLRYAKSHGNQIILWTCRTGKDLEFAVDWCKDFGLAFDAVNENVKEAIERYGGDSRKVYADIYVDDKNSKLHFYEFPYDPVFLECKKY